MDKLRHERSLLRFAQLFGAWVLKVERALLLLNLILVVDCLENAGAKLGSHLSKYTVCLQRLDDHVLKFVHLCYFVFFLHSRLVGDNVSQI